MSAHGLAAALAAMPYASFLGLEACDEEGVDAVMRFAPTLIGNPLLPALHGGSIAGFMEATAMAVLTARGTAGKPIDVSIAYLRSGRPEDVRSRADIRKIGRRIAYVHVTAWQEDAASPIAEMSAHFLLTDKS